MALHGKNIIGGKPSAQSGRTFHAVNPVTGEKLTPVFHEGSPAEADQALTMAEAAFEALRGRSLEDRALLLEAIAAEIETLGDALLERCQAETGLAAARLSGERTRTMNQARLFAQVVREGVWLDVRIDPALPDRKPLPRPDLRRMHVPLGPVVVFGASNFPLAISVVGTDTIAALGAGCPVVVKAHPAHPGTSEMIAAAIGRAVERCGLPPGCFSLLHGAGHEIGMALVKHPLTCAVAFTGSFRGGKALRDAALARERPIPVSAEMGSTNPVFVLPGALQERGEQIAQGYVQSTALGVGQFCTNPGLLFGLRGEPMRSFIDAVGRQSAQVSPASMLHAGMCETFAVGVDRFSAMPGVRVVGRSQAQANRAATQAALVIFAADASTFAAKHDLHAEVFGPSSLIVEADSREQLLQLANALEGQLTATIHGTADDLKQHDRLLRVLERKVGRLVFNGFPTGVEVSPAMHHGGPYPATFDAHWTSIGTAAILRFVRPLCYQGFPEASLPPPLRNANPRGLWRLIDNRWSQAEVG